MNFIIIFFILYDESLTSACKVNLNGRKDNEKNIRRIESGIIEDS